MLQSHSWVLCFSGPAFGLKGRLLRWSPDMSSWRQGPCPASGGRARGLGAWGCPAGQVARRGFCYRYSSSRACLSASRSAWQDIRQKGMLCWNTEHRPHGHGPPCVPRSPPHAAPTPEPQGASARVSRAWGHVPNREARDVLSNPPPAASTHQFPSPLPAPIGWLVSGR